MAAARTSGLTESSLLVKQRRGHELGILADRTQRFGQDRPIFQSLRQRQE